MPLWLRRSSYALAVLAVVAAGFQAYSIFPARFAVPALALPVTTRELVLIVHGSGGREEPTLRVLEQVLESRPGGFATVVVRYVWAPWSDDRFRTWPNGRRVGASLGEELATLPGLASVHLIAHSAGAYVLDPLCRAYRERGGAARLRMTFLDPIGFRGPLDPGWGARHHGECADEAEAFINTDDPAPATASPLRHARTTDVTGDPRRARFAEGGHRWPVQYYVEQLKAREGPPAPTDSHATSNL
jgi:hypothetical protein